MSVPATHTGFPSGPICRDATESTVLVDGGHGQFWSDAALSSGDAADYQRYLEGRGLASALGSALRLGSAVTDYSNNLNGDDVVPVTANFDSTFDLFDPCS